MAGAESRVDPTREVVMAVEAMVAAAAAAVAGAESRVDPTREVVMAVEAMVAEDSLAATGADRAATGVEEAAAAEVAGPDASESTRKSSPRARLIIRRMSSNFFVNHVFANLFYFFVAFEVPSADS